MRTGQWGMTMRIAAGIALTLSLLASAAWAADPAGTYNVKGRNPGGSGAYSGTVVVQKSGDTYQVVWDIDGTSFVGTGVGNDEFLAVGYESKSFNGLAMYIAKGDTWDGIWTAIGGKQIGTEVWTKQ
jgi:hypothetical protein